MSRDFFNKAAENTVQLEKQIMPEPYKYYKFIRTPKEMGMSTKGGMKELQNNVASLVSYGELLISGKGPAGTVAPLGNKYFLKTGGQCNASDDKESPKIVDRYAYIDNVPRGNIPMSDNSFIKFQEFKGLIPGMMQDIEDINTATLFRGFMEEEHPRCHEYSLPVRDNNNKDENVSHFIADSDVREMNACSFPDRKNPITGATCAVSAPKPSLKAQQIKTNDPKLKTLEKSEYGGHIPGAASTPDHDHSEHHPQGIDERSGAGAPRKTPGQMAAAGAGNVAGMAAGMVPGGLAGMKNAMSGGLGGLKQQAMAMANQKVSGLKNKAIGMAKQQAMSYAKKAKTKAMSYAKKKMGGMFSSFFGGFQNKYDNKTLCSKLDKDPFARFYIISFIFLLGFLIYKAFLKKNRIKNDPSMIFIVSVMIVFGYLIYKHDHQLINLYKYGKYTPYHHEQ